MSNYLDENGTSHLWWKIKTWVGSQGYLTSHQAVVDSDVTLSWGTRSKIGSVGSTDIHVKMPSNPNTHQKAYKTMHLENYYGAAVQEDISATQAEDTFTIKSGTDIKLSWASSTKELTISAPAVSSKVDKSGDTMTGLLTSNTAHGNSWNKARDSAFIRSHGFANQGSYYPAISWLHQGGNWSIGSLGNSNYLYLSHVRDTEYSGNNCSDNYYLAPPADGNAHSYAIAHSGNVGTGDGNCQVKIAGTNVTVKNTPALISDIYPTLIQQNGSNNWIKIGTSNTNYGLLPSTSGSLGSGHNYIGTSSWYWKYSYIDEMYCNHLHYNAMNTLVELCTWGTYADTGTTVTLKEAVTNYHFIVIRVGSDTDAGTTTVGGMQFIYLPSSANLTGNQINILFAQQSNLQAMKCSFPSATSFKILGRKTLVGSGWYSGVRCIYGLWKK